MNKDSALAILRTVDEHCQAGLNSGTPVHMEAALLDIMDSVRSAIIACPPTAEDYIMYTETSTADLQNAYAHACYATWATFAMGLNALHKTAHERAEAIRRELTARGAF